MVAELNCDLGQIERWIRLIIPQAEDGNNWGVEVQLHALKIIQEERQKLKTAQDNVKEYYRERAEALEKILDTTEEKETTSTSKNKATGGEKDIDENKESSSTEKVVKKNVV